MDHDADLLPAPATASTIEDADREALRQAVVTLEHSSLAARLSAALGKQIDVAAQFVPAPILSVVNKATMSALRFALKGAVRSLRNPEGLTMARPRLHIAFAALSGAAGGAFGLTALPIELPVSTTIMLRSIAEIARAEGEDLTDPAAMLACLEVFALGSGSQTGPAGESGYLATRSLLAKSVTEAARYLVQRGVADESAPVIVRLLTQIASRFGVVVGQKSMTQAIPVIGAVTGAVVNAAFTDHFQALARAHFTVRRLERRYGADPVRALFEALKDALAKPDKPAGVTPPLVERIMPPTESAEEAGSSG